jgi:hypothetical protein
MHGATSGSCGKCGLPGPRWALCCRDCATQDPAHEELTLCVSPTLSSRVGNWLRETSIIVGIVGLALLGAILVGRIGNYFLGGWFGNIVLLVVLVFGLATLGVPFLSFPDIWRNLDVGSVSNWRASRQLVFNLSTSTLEARPGSETRFHEASIDLHDVKLVVVKQSWIERALCYGNVLLYTTPGGPVAMAFVGVVDPAGFAQRVEELVASAPELPKAVGPAAL